MLLYNVLCCIMCIWHGIRLLTWISYNMPSFPKAIVIGGTWSKFCEIDMKIIIKVKHLRASL